MAMFTMNINTSLDIDANPHEIWRVLTDFEAYDEWNPMLRNVRTCMLREAPVRFEVIREDARPLKLAAKITEHKPGSLLAWRGGSRVFISGEHYFRIEQLGNYRSRFHHGERFHGLFLPLMRPLLKSAFPLYSAMSRALKCVVEREGESELNSSTMQGEQDTCSNNQRSGELK